jgi:hypothetical protein
MDCIQCCLTSRHSSQEVHVHLNKSSRHRRQYSVRPRPLDLTRVSRYPAIQRRRNIYNRPPTPYPHQHLSHNFTHRVTETRRPPRRRVAHVLVTRGIREYGRRYHSRDGNYDTYSRPKKYPQKSVSFADQQINPSHPVGRHSTYDQVIESFSNLELDPDSRKPRHIFPL